MSSRDPRVDPRAGDAVCCGEAYGCPIDRTVTVREAGSVQWLASLTGMTHRSTLGEWRKMCAGAEVLHVAGTTQQGGGS